MITDPDDNSAFLLLADVDFLVDFSPVTGEVHLAATDENISS